jgi:hypothetical protein
LAAVFARSPVKRESHISQRGILRRICNEMIGFSGQFLPCYAQVDALASQFQLTFIFSVSYDNFSESFVNRPMRQPF